MKLLFHGIGYYSLGKEFGPARWSNADLLVLREGELEFHTQSGVVRLRAGDAVWIPAGVKFWGMSQAEKSVMWVVHFDGRQWKLKDVAAETVCSVGVFRGALESSLAQELRKRLDELYLGEARWAPLAEIYFTALLAEIRRNHFATPPENPWLDRLKAWAITNLPRGIGVREMAEQAGLSESHFRQRFREEQGNSVGNFLRELRLNEAEKLVRQTPIGLKEISMRVGYSDPVAFHRAFRNRFGVSPGAYRKNMQAAL